MTEPIRVVLVDDDESIRKLIRWTLDMDPRFKVVGEAFDGRSAMRTIEMERPDAVVLDLVMPNMDGYNTLTQIPYSSPDSKIMILTDAEVEPRVAGAARQMPPPAEPGLVHEVLDEVVVVAELRGSAHDRSEGIGRPVEGHAP